MKFQFNTYLIVKSYVVIKSKNSGYVNGGYLLSRYDLYELEVKCAKTITRTDAVFGAPSGYVYIELQMDEELFEGGRTVR